MIKYTDIKKYFNIQDIQNLLLSLSNFPYFGALASLLNSFFDVCEIYKGFTHYNIYKNQIKIKTGAFRFTCNLLLGLAGLFPLLAIASCLLVNPFILPLISFSLVVSNFYKACVITKITKYELSIDKRVVETSLNENSIQIFSVTEKNLYISQRECIANSVLMVGAAVSLLGVIFPPFLLVGLGIGMAGGLLSVLDKKLFFCKKIVRMFDKKEDSSSNFKNIMESINHTHSKTVLQSKKIDHTYNKIFKQIPPIGRKLKLTPSNQPFYKIHNDYFYRSSNNDPQEVRACYRRVR
jgi:hypothetical protein